MPFMAALALFLTLGMTPRVGQSQTGGVKTSACDPSQCANCAAWNAPHATVRIFGNSFYVATSGLSAILITSPGGHVLIDGGLPESAPHILANIAALGFRATDIKMILNSHAHFDHAGGIAELARVSGARVAATVSSAVMMRTGKAGRDDPQYAVALAYPAVTRVDEIADRDTLRVGWLALVGHITAGHTAGGTTWSWRSCEGTRCVELVYADNQSPISDDDFHYTGDPRYPKAIADFTRGYAALEKLQCDILITPHPGGSNFWARIASGMTGASPALIDTGACNRYAASSRTQLETRLATERKKR